MSNTLSKLVSIFSYTLLAVSVLLFVGYLSGWNDEGILIGWVYVLTALSIGITLAFAFIGLAMFPKKAKFSLIGVGALFLIFGISYLFSSDGSVSTHIMEKSGISLNMSHLIGMGLVATYILSIFALIGIVFTEISKIFK
jgi:hypothetical protein